MATTVLAGIATTLQVKLQNPKGTQLVLLFDM